MDFGRLFKLASLAGDVSSFCLQLPHLLERLLEFLVSNTPSLVGAFPGIATCKEAVSHMPHSRQVMPNIGQEPGLSSEDDVQAQEGPSRQSTSACSSSEDSEFK